jgi:excisionase family DNA binding protein
MPDYLSRDDAAKYLRCSIRKIDRLKQSGRLPFLKLDGNTLFRKEHLKSLPVETAHLEALLKPGTPTAKSWQATRITPDASELPFGIRRPFRRAEFA